MSKQPKKSPKKPAPGSWFLAPATDRYDEYAAGYEANEFSSRAEAEAAIPGLLDAFAAMHYEPTEWVAVRRPIHCECGNAMGQPCEWSGPVADTVVVEWMPEWLRASHEAAGNRGTWPHNGAERLRVSADCAENLTGEWCREVRS